MQKLYYENPYQRDFTAEITNILEKDKKYHIELDNTCFYPEDDMFSGDTGHIDSSAVTHVYEEGGKVYHITEVKPSRIHRVKCGIDWDKRFKFMQKNLGCYILSGCFSELFNTNTIGTHPGKDTPCIDIDRIIENAEIAQIEQAANRIVAEGIKVEMLYLTGSELKKLTSKKIPVKAGEKIKLVKIGNFEAVPCSGILPVSTIEAQLIKIVGFDKNKTGTRIKFICGSEAASDYILKYEWIEKMSKLLSCEKIDVLKNVEGLSGELKRALSEKNSLKSDIAQYEVQEMLNSCDNIKNIRVLKSVFDNSDLKHVNLLASKLALFPNVIVLFGVTSGDKAQLIFMRSKDLNIIDMTQLLKDAISLIDGKGGGNDFSAQGGGKNNNNLNSAIDYAFNRVKDCIISL